MSDIRSSWETIISNGIKQIAVMIREWKVCGSWINNDEIIACRNTILLFLSRRIGSGRMTILSKGYRCQFELSGR